MNILTFVFGPRRSLRRGLLLNIIAALCLSILLAGAVLIREFNEHLKDNLNNAMIGEATEIAGLIDPQIKGLGLDADYLRYRGSRGRFRYTVFDGNNHLLVGGETSAAIRAQMAKIRPGESQVLSLEGGRHGIALRDRVKDQEILILVSTYPKTANDSQLTIVLRVIGENSWWIAFTVMLVLASAFFATRRALKPLLKLSAQVDQIGPTAANRRLETGQVPAEMAPVIEGVNKAFDRLEQGYKAQRDFSANVAHEIRTPLAVLRSSVERITDPELKRTLLQDQDKLDRIFGQLIDLSRADAALQSGFEPVDLHAIAVETATDLALPALQAGRSLSVVGEQDVTVEGNGGLLAIAMHNVVRNALQYTPENSEVEIELLSNPVGWRVLDRGIGVPDDLKTALFERFNRGAQKNSSLKGSGIGLAIVKSVADSHKASVSVQDREGGGSIFSFIFNSAL